MKKLLVLVLVLVVCVGVYFAVVHFSKDPDPITMDAIAFYTVEAEDLAKLSWDYQDQTVTLIQSDAGWQVESDPEFPLDPGLPKVMATRLHDLVALSTLTEFDPDLSNYGLDKPVAVIRATTRDGQTTTLSVGSYTSTVGGYYLLDDQTPEQLYIVEEPLLKAFSYQLYDLVQKESIPAMASIVRLSVKDGDHSFLVQYFEDPGDLTYTDQYSWFTQDSDGVYRAASINKIVSLASNVANLSLKKCVAYEATDQELTAYGLDDASAAVIAMGYQDDLKQEQTFTLLLGNYDGDSCYARIQGSRMVYLVDASVVDPLLVATPDTVAPDDVCLMNWDSVSSMDLSLDGQSAAITFGGTQETTSIDGVTSQQAVYTSGEQTLDSAAVTAVLDSLSAMQAAQTVTDSASGRREAISFTFHRASGSFAEMTLSFYQYNASSYLVTFTDQPTRLVDASAVSTLLTQAKTLLASLS